MVQLNVTDPQHPHADYRSNGAEVHLAVDCNCPNNNATCLAECQTKAQDALDELLAVFPETP